MRRGLSRLDEYQLQAEEADAKDKTRPPPLQMDLPQLLPPATAARDLVKEEEDLPHPVVGRKHLLQKAKFHQQERKISAGITRIIL